MTKIKSRNIISGIIVILLLVAVLVSTANATFQYHNHYFKESNKLTFKLDPVFSEQSKTGFSNACSQWNAPFSKTLLARSTSTSSITTTYPNKDGTCTVYREKSSGVFPGMTKVYTNNYPSSTGYVVEADIRIDISMPFINSANPPEGYFDTETVMLHELGHVMGLAHPTLPHSGDTVMNAAPAGTARRTIGSEDKTAVKTKVKS